MKQGIGTRVVKFFISLCMVVSVILPGNMMVQADDNETIVLVHTNDVHGSVAVEPYVKAVADSYKTLYGNQNVLTLSAGDVFAGGESIAHLTNGESIVDIMNAANYDAMALGNNDTGLGIGQAIHLASETNFPILAANLYSNGTDTSTSEAAALSAGEPAFDAYEIFETTSGTKVGVFGITTCFAGSNSDYNYTASIDAANDCVAELQSQGCDIIVALTHTGWPDGDATMTATSSNDTNSYLIAMNVDGIDVIIDGHTHSVINNGNGYVCPNSSQTLIVQAGSSGSNIGVVSIDYHDGNITAKTASLLSNANGDFSAYTPDSSVTSAIDSWETQLDAIVGSVVGHTAYNLNGARASASWDGKGVRMAEQNLGNFITDAIRNGSNADIVFLQGVRLRASIDAGDIQLRDLYSVMAIGADMYQKSMTGAEILNLLPTYIAAACNSQESTSFMQVSGLQFIYDKTNGEIVSAKLPDGTNLNPTQTYTVLFDSFMPVADAAHPYSGDAAIVELVQNYLNSSAYNTLDYSGPEGRIVELSDIEREEVPTIGDVTVNRTANGSISLSADYEAGSNEITTAGFILSSSDGSSTRIYGTMENGKILTDEIEINLDETYDVKGFALTFTGYKYGDETSFIYSTTVSPKTSDYNLTGLYIILCISACASIALVYKKRKQIS